MAADLRSEEKAIAKLQENREISPLKPQNASPVWFLFSVAVEEYSHVNMLTTRDDDVVFRCGTAHRS